MDIKEMMQPILSALEYLDDDHRIEALNEIRLALHKISPLRDEPADCVLWVNANNVYANDYNPNVVAPPEMHLLEHSVMVDGFTQAIVTFRESDDHLEVVDGFHRNRVGRENQTINKRLLNRLPVTIINDARSAKPDRIAATIRHNRARGKHRIDAMSDIVLDLTRRNWSNAKIAKELGMEADEVLRLQQITGLAELFADREFSQAWEAV